MTTSRHGLTLLDVLLASAILAMLAAVCTPTVARALGLLRHVEPARSIDAVDLARAANEITSSSASAGFGGADHKPHLYEVVEMEIPWPAIAKADDRQIRPPIRIRRLPPSAPDHVWLAFECDGLTVCRWTPIPDETPSPGGNR